MIVSTRRKKPPKTSPEPWTLLSPSTINRSNLFFSGSKFYISGRNIFVIKSANFLPTPARCMDQSCTLIRTVAVTYVDYNTMNSGILTIVTPSPITVIPYVDKYFCNLVSLFPLTCSKSSSNKSSPTIFLFSGSYFFLVRRTEAITTLNKGHSPKLRG